MGKITRASIQVSAIALFASSPAFAGVGPEIAYQEQHQNGDEIYLINPDGTGRSLLFKAPSKNFVNSLDMKPGGGELAVSLRTRLFIINYDDRGVKTASREIPMPSSGCSVGSLDYHPSDGSLIAVQACGSNNSKMYRLPAGATSFDPSPLLSLGYYVGGRWSRSGTKIFYEYGGAPGIFALDPVAGSSTPVTGTESWGLSDMLLLGDKTWWVTSGGPAHNPTGSYEIGDIDTLQTTNGCRLAMDIHFGKNDTQMVFRTPPAQGGYYVMVQNADCSGRATVLTGKGAFYYVDWRAP